MGIINLTPDSFHDGGKTASEKELLHLAEKHLRNGALFLDIGGVSTRPGATDVPLEEEWGRLKNALHALVREFPKAIISIDTYRSEIARRGVEQGAHIINDISGGQLDGNMFGLAAQLQVPYILMHMQGTPATMQQNPHYDDVVREVMDYFLEKFHQLKKAGVHDIILDPGFGFGKNLVHNYTLLNYLKQFEVLGCPILVGVSRKAMVNRLLKTKPETALNGTTAIHMLALQQGAKILRVHDAKEAMQAIAVYGAFLGPERL